MNERRGKRTYSKPQITSEKVFEQAALSCVVVLEAGATVRTLKIDWVDHGCGYTSS